MRDIRARLLALEDARGPEKCLACEFRRLNGGPAECPNGLRCGEPGKSIVDYIQELDRAQAAGDAQ